MNEVEFQKRFEDAVRRYKKKIGNRTSPSLWVCAMEALKESGLPFNTNASITGNVIVESIKNIVAVMEVRHPEDVLRIKNAANVAWEYFEKKQKEEEVSNLRPSQIA